MIVQCDQCNARFKLDDSKIKPGGVKVRCSKCKQIFEVRKESPQDEPDFDSLLSGLDGAQGAAAGAATVSTAGATGNDVGAGATGDDVGADEPNVAASNTEWGDFGSESEDVDYGALNVSDTAGAAGGKPGEEEGGTSPSGDSSSMSDAGSDYGDFNFTAGASASAPEPASPPDDSGFNFGDFNFGALDEKIEPPTEDAAPTSTSPEASLQLDSFDFSADEGETGFSFPGQDLAEPQPAAAVASPVEPSSQVDDTFSFGDDFSAASTGEEFAFTEQKTETEKDVAAEDAPAFPASGGKSPATAEALSFEAFDFASSPQDTDFSQESPVLPAAKEETVPAPQENVAIVSPSAPLFPSDEEDAPPLSIASRRKGSSSIPFAVLSVSVILVLAIAGGGVLLFQKRVRGTGQARSCFCRQTAWT